MITKNNLGKLLDLSGFAKTGKKTDNPQPKC